jgi:hypothetical protein
VKRDVNDTLCSEGTEAVRKRHDKARKYNGSGLTILSKAEFIKGFRPPDYLIEGILQRQFCYAMTGQTGHAKTAVALLTAELISSSQEASLDGHQVDKGTVAYFCGENPTDVIMRVIGADAVRLGIPDEDRIFFIPGVFNIDQMLASIEAAITAKIGKLDLIIVDTSAAYFLGNEELSNTQMGDHARMLRRLTKLPGGPCVLVLCHPIKHVNDPSQLLPRGGGAFLCEVDGNLTLWKRDDDTVELHYNKIRGPGFEPISFRLDRIRTAELVDTKGRPLSTVRAVAISEAEGASRAHRARSDEDTLLTALQSNGDKSVADLARACGWVTGSGEPYKSKVQRVIKHLEKAKLVKKERDGWRLTDAGRKAAGAAEAKIEPLPQLDLYN